MVSNQSDTQRNLRLPGGVVLPTALVAALTFLVRFLGEPTLETQRPTTTIEGTRPDTISPLRSVTGGMGEDPIKAAYEDFAKDEEAQPAAKIRKHFTNVITRLLALSDDSKFLLLPVMVTGSPFAEAVEQRKRTRYAVDSGLGRAGYSMGYSDRITYAPIEVVIHYRNGPNGPGQNFETKKIVVPIKLYRPNDIGHDLTDHDSKTREKETNYAAVIVCWIAESWLGDRPMEALEQIIDVFCDDAIKELDTNSDQDKSKSANRIDIKILGPSSSDLLFKILKNENKRKCKQRAEGTASQIDSDSNETTSSEKPPGEQKGLLEQAGAQMLIMRSTVNPQHVRQPSGLEKIESANGATLIRTIGSDDHLGHAIWDELNLRGIQPNANRHIVLITERDTIYGRALPTSLRQYKEKKGDDSDNIHVFTYFRGIDGRKLASGQKKSDDESQIIDRPKGRSHYDYLRRMRKQIAEQQAELQIDGCRISAIGVLATDAYDKLLILQALRSYFPDICFFTTDLDAGMSHVSAYDYTRNVIVASHFGLQLHPALQGDVAPFRDSYQTSAFFSTLFALQPEEISKGFKKTRGIPEFWNPTVESGVQARNTRHLEPLVFEIGRNGPYQLTMTGGSEHSQHSHGNDQQDGTTALRAFARVQSLSPRDKPSSMSIVLRIARLPMSFVVLGVLVCLYFERTRDAMFFAMKYEQQRRLFEERKFLSAVWGLLWRLVIFVCLPPFVIVLLVAWFHSSENGEPFSLTEGISVWPTLLLKVVAGLLATASLVRILGGMRISEQTERLPNLLCRLVLGNPAPIVLPNLNTAVRHCLTRIPLHRWQQIESDETPNIRELMKEFSWKASPWAQVLRASIFTLLLSLFGMLIYSLTGSVSIGVRGWWLRGFLVCVTLLVYFLFFFLTTLIIDSIQLCRLLSKRLGRGTTGWSTDLPELAPIGGAYRNQTEAAAVKSVQLIAEGTERVSRKIWALGLVSFLLFAAHYPYFEYFAVPWSTIIILSPILIGVVVCTVAMRIEAQKARMQILKRLQFRSLAEDVEVEVSENAAAAIAEEQRGAFRPLSRDPLVQVLAIPFGGTSGLILLEQSLRLISG